MDKHYTLCVLVENNAGVLSKVVGLFSRRGFNIHSLSVGTTNDVSVSRITIEVIGNEQTVDQIAKQLSKLVDVIKIKTLEEDELVKRSLVLIKVKTTSETRSQIIEMANIFRAKVVDISQTTLTCELTGQSKKIDGFIELMDSFGIEEIARTGVTALERGSNTLKL